MNNENCLPRRPLKPTAYIPKVLEFEVPDLSMCSDFSDEETLDASSQTRQFGEKDVDFQPKASRARETSLRNKTVQPDYKLSSVRNTKDFSFANVNTNSSKFSQLDMPHNLPRKASSSLKNKVVQSDCNAITKFPTTKVNSTRPNFQDSDIQVANQKLDENTLKICGKPQQNNQSLQPKIEKSTRSLGNLSNRSINTRMEMNEYLHSQKFDKKQVKCTCCPENQILQNPGIFTRPLSNCSVSPCYGPCEGQAKQMLNTAQQFPAFSNGTICAVSSCHNIIDASGFTMTSDKINKNQMCEHALCIQSVRENMSPCETSSSISYQTPKEKATGNDVIALVSQTEAKPTIFCSSNIDCNNKDDLFLKHIKSQDEKLAVIQEQLSLLLEKNRKHTDTKLLERKKMTERHDNETNASVSDSDLSLDFLKGDGKDESSYDPRVCSLLMAQQEQIQQLSQQLAILMKEQSVEESNSSNKEIPMLDKNKTLFRNTPGSCKDNFVGEMLDHTKTCSTGTMTSFVLVDKKEVYDSCSKQSTGQCCKCGDKPVKKITTTQIIVATEKTHSENSSRKTSRKSDRSHQKLDEKGLRKSDCSKKSDFSIEYEDCSSSACSKNLISSNSANSSRPSPGNKRVSGEFYEKVMGNMDRIISKQQMTSNISPAVSTAVKSVSPVSRRSSQLEIDKKTSKQDCRFSTPPNHVPEEKFSSKDMSLEFKKLTAKYLDKDDILEVQESCMLSTNFSNATLEYLETYGLLPKKSIPHHKKLRK